VLGLGRVPTEEERTLLALSLAAAAVAALLAPRGRRAASELARTLAGGARQSPDDVLRGFGSRLTRAIPLDELLLQLAESLRTAFGLRAAEVWTGSEGLFERTAADPERGSAQLALGAEEEAVVVRAGVSGSGWAAVWLPGLVAGREDAALRVAPVAHAGALLGLIVAERPRDGEPFSADDERVLAELARDVGIVLNTARLDSALQASLAEVRRQADDLRASRARVVAAADAERRRIERDLHDGAQQRLIALAVKLRLVRELAAVDPAQAKAVLAELGDDLERTIEELRDLAHGIYPPLLARRGLRAALSTAALGASDPVLVDVATRARYPAEVEAAVYFCCLEALQNAAKHAGDGARVMLSVHEDEDALVLEVSDDGAGFDPRASQRGAGIANMADRLGAIGGRMRIESTTGAGTRVVGTIPLGTMRDGGGGGTPNPSK